MKKVCFALICISLISNTFAQVPDKPSSAEIYHKLQKLQVLASVLYVAAHPDDENTRMISYFSNERHAHTTYLSLTRGDGGQNLVGPQIRELLGAIRTQELLAARRTDGGHQRFTRANDFGYSKHPDETLQLWNKEDVLSDVVWTIRSTRPDIIINRFDHRSPGRTHGHHTSSAMLSVDAFDKTGSTDVFPEQLRYVKPWSTQRVFFNTSWWFYGSRAKFAEADKTNLLSVDVGVYYPLLGKSNNEIASLSRSMHKSQGFGSTGARGSEVEYLELIKGDMPQEDALAGINTTWSRIAGGAPIGEALAMIDRDFDHTNPSASVPALLSVHSMISQLEDDGFWVPMKKKEVEDLLKHCAGIYVEAVADHYVASPGAELPVYVEAINRSDADVTLKHISFPFAGLDTSTNLVLENNVRFNSEKKLNIPGEQPYTSPYWLREKGTLGMYHVADQKMIGIPEPSSGLQMEYLLAFGDVEIPFSTTLVYKRNDPVKGEVYRPFEIMPPVYLQVDEDVFVFSGAEAKTVDVLVKCNRNNLNGSVALQLPDGWVAEPANHDIMLAESGEEELISFQLTPPAQSAEGDLQVIFTSSEGDKYDQSASIIDYDYIPTQTILEPATARIVKVDLIKRGSRVAYIEGAGDKIPESLRQVGYEVVVIDPLSVSTATLAPYDAVILGIRAYNTVDRIKFFHDDLMSYVEQGGTLLVQYNTSRRLPVPSIGPYPMQLSRDRVAVEEAEIRVLQPEHAVMNRPNKITEKDFDNWVQERGLYFADEWDDKYTAILSSNDPGEDPRNGGLLIAKHGKGHFIYSGYSWFRQLPAGVPGAYRLFVNLISLGSDFDSNTSGGSNE